MIIGKLAFGWYRPDDTQNRYPLVGFKWDYRYFTVGMWWLMVWVRRHP